MRGLDHWSRPADVIVAALRVSRLCKLPSQHIDGGTTETAPRVRRLGDRDVRIQSWTGRDNGVDLGLSEKLVLGADAKDECRAEMRVFKGDLAQHGENRRQAG